MGQAWRLVEQGGQVVEADASLRGVNGPTGEEADHFVEESIARVGDAVSVLERC